MLKIRLRRQGAKFQPHYRVVVADSRSPRDGRFVTILGYYDPRTEPPTIHLDGDQIASWVAKGAQPTDAVLRLMRQSNVGADVVAKFAGKNNNNSHNKDAAAAPDSSAATAAAAEAETAE